MWKPFEADSVYYTVPQSAYMKTLVFLVTSFFFACTNPEKSDVITDKSDTTSYQIRFISANKIPVIECVLNGKRAFFIVDSGASVSVLDLAQDDFYKFYSVPLDEEGAGYGGPARFYSVQGVRVMVGSRLLKVQFRSQNLSSIVDLIKQHEGVRIAGILGSDVWKDLDAVIDYKKQLIVIQ
jgi:hypothetical protein